MTNGEAINWLINITADIGKAEHRDLWHYEQALSEIREMLEALPEAGTQMSLPSAQPDVTDINVGNFESKIHAMFDHIWDCEIGHPVFQDTVGELMDAVIRCYNRLPSAQPDLDEWCTDCKEYDHERHCCPRYNRVIRDAVEEAKSDDDWVPVKKRLPEESGTYLVTHHYDYVPVGCIQTDALDFEDGAWYWWNEKGELEKWDDPIIAWKPMPEPWKGEENEE